MCGIAGILSPNPAKITGERLKKMTDAIAHRGPDGEGCWLSPSGLAGLGHRRLSIIDLSPAGAQPMSCLGRYTVIHNGEIYNYRELRSLLQSKGYAFSSRTDTEIIPAAYDLYGPGCVQYFDGMFAFALWDEKEKTLFLARDRFGEKPLFFYRDGEQFVFASEMKALWAAGIIKESNHNMLFNFITIGYTQNPADGTETFFNDIKKLPARSYLLYHALTQQMETRVYWDPRPEPPLPGADKTSNPPADKSESVLLATFSTLLSDSVNKRLRSDVTVGTSLSGGLDSSAIVSYIRRQPETPTILPTFSAVFPGFEKDETPFIDLVTRHFSLENYRTEPTAAGLIRDFEQLAAHQEEPFQSSSIYAQFCVFGLAASRNVKVLLDGQGADELLAGYSKYYPRYWRELYSSDKKALAPELAAAKRLGAAERWTWKDRLASLLPEYAGSFFKKRRIASQFHHPDLSREFTRSGVSYYEIPPVANLNGVLYYNTLMNGLEELLRYADRNSMAHGVEVRLPFLDHRLAEFLFSLPAHFKIREGWTKWMLRAGTEHLLPSGIVWRKDKIGYEPPQYRWMTDKTLREYIQ
ncbi:MAG TPA: asparagine synthase (glutamine-hydrolyzing), partial [Puia sp.]|nr:asparagine synthase (glutamine-hydrolyzing) [Puia sp.]